MGREMEDMITAIVLIKCERGSIRDLGPKLKDVPRIAEAYSVTGPYDFVAIVRASATDSRT